MTYYNSSSYMMETSNSYSPSGSAGPSSQPTQNGIFDRVSTIFGGKRRNNQNQDSSNSSVHMYNADPMNVSQVDSMFTDDRTASCVDSMYSSLQSRRSNYRPVNSNAPPPLRTVQLENPIVHLPTPPLASVSTPFDPKSTAAPLPSKSTPVKPPSPTYSPSPSPPSSSSPETDTNDTIEDIDKQFNLLLREYAPNAIGANNSSDLTVEQKLVLIQFSKAEGNSKRTSSFANVMPSIKATLGIRKNKSSAKSKPASTMKSMSFETSDHFKNFNQQNPNHLMNRVKANTAPGRNGKARSVLPTSGFQSYGRKTSRSKLKSTPEYFVHLLTETYVRDLQDSEILYLRVFLRSEGISWTSEFLSKGGYEAISNLFDQMKNAPKRYSNDNRILQHLSKCLKTIMTHQPMGTQIVLSNPVALSHVRDILFGKASKKQRQIYGFDISTRSQLLNLLCTLATIQTTRSSDFAYVHGYDVLRRLLLNRPTDRLEDEEDKKNQARHHSPFPVTLKTNPMEILQMIADNDPNGQVIGSEYHWDDRNDLKPRYTAWMRELHLTVEKDIETITFLATALNYHFDSAHKQLRLNKFEPDQVNQSGLSGSSVMCEEGVIDYIITHLRLIRTVVTTQPTSYTGIYDEREQEKMRLELMLSGFDKISKILYHCPHPIIRNSYINYLKPLMSPCADLSATQHTYPNIYYDQQQTSSSNTDFQTEFSNEIQSDDEAQYELSVYANDENEQITDNQEERGVGQWRYEDDPYDDIFLNSGTEDGNSDMSMIMDEDDPIDEDDENFHSMNFTKS